MKKKVFILIAVFKKNLRKETWVVEVSICSLLNVKNKITGT